MTEVQKLDGVRRFLDEAKEEETVWQVLLWIKENEPSLIHEANGELEMEYFNAMSKEERLESLKLDMDLAFIKIQKIIKEEK